MGTALIIISATLICTFFLVLSALSLLDRLNDNLRDISHYLYELSDIISDQRSDNENDNS